ncbi:hypothetical protein HDU91_007347 [Kappamyces sp. JEL0680]|nr:hypothetical protein HDU91_007347 [Kappamyces sp. JEL0680]
MSATNQILDVALKSTSAHEKGSQKLIKLLKTDPGSREDFFQALLLVADAKKETTSIKGFAQFMDRFFSNLVKGHGNEEFLESFQNSLIEFLLQGLRASAKQARLQCIQTLFSYMNNIEELGEIRQTVLANLELTEAALPLFLERARDVHPTVRMELYQRLSSERQMLLSMESSDLLEFLDIGFKERYWMAADRRDASVRKGFCELVFQNLFTDEVHVFEDDERIELVIPNLTFWCNLLLTNVLLASETAEHDSLESIICEMIQITQLLDLSDDPAVGLIAEGILGETALNSQVIYHSVVLLQKIATNTHEFLQ